MGLFGGLLGCGIGLLTHGTQTSSIVSSSQGGGKAVILELAVTPNTLLAGLLLALAMGLAGGLLPALSAMRLKPLESMR
jgi:ABC-type antimicrobial peptide transport system permease subunit